MRDLIDRDEAIEAIRTLPNAGMRWFVSAEAVFDKLLNLPSVYPEQKNGQWIPTKYEKIYTCSKCKHEYGMIGSTFQYCPYCGAKMYVEVAE